jgi:hypothetical protein
MDQLAGMIALVAADRFGGLDAVETEVLGDAADICRRYAAMGR